jgi:hypothetical protein
MKMERYHWACFDDDYSFATVVDPVDMTPPVVTVPADVVADATGVASCFPIATDPGRNAVRDRARLDRT